MANSNMLGMRGAREDIVFYFQSNSIMRRNAVASSSASLVKLHSFLLTAMLLCCTSVFAAAPVKDTVRAAKSNLPTNSADITAPASISQQMTNELASENAAGIPLLPSTKEANLLVASVGTVALSANLSENTAKIYDIDVDHLGTPRAVTDANGRLVWEWQSPPFGDALPNQNPSGLELDFVLNLRFAGQVYDLESGMHYNYYRDYNPATGRYLQSDPIGLAGGVNTYIYVLNQPIKYIDPTGELAFLIPPAIILSEMAAGSAIPAATGIAVAAILITPGDQSEQKTRAVPYPDRKRGKYTCICRANKDGRSANNCSNDNLEFAMGYGEGATLSDAKRAAEKDAKDKLGARSTHHIQCRCTSPNGDRVIPHG